MLSNSNNSGASSLAIDLHRLSVKEAKKKVSDAFEDAKEAKSADLTIVTGIGNHVNTNGSRAVLFNALPKWLKKSEFSARIRNIKKDRGAYEIQFNFNEDFTAHVKKINDTYSSLTQEQIKSLIADLQQKADSGHTESQGLLGTMYVLGVCIPQNINKGLPLLTKAAKHSVGTQAQLGAIYSSNHFANIKNYKTALDWYSRAAQNNDAEALYALGKMHWLGRGIIKSPKNDKKAIAYLTRAAKLGHIGAAHSLGDIYFTGVDGISKNQELAAQYYEQAATTGVVDAQVKLAKQYYFGWGVAQDYEKAFFWFEQAAETDAVAQYYLARLYLMRDELGNLFAATIWFKRAADNGDIDARFEVAFGYLTGRGPTKDVAVAARLLSQLAIENHAHSNYLLSEILTTPGPLQDVPRAIRLLITAAELDQVDAQHTLINYYLEKKHSNLITTAIFKRVADKLELLANQGDDRAQCHLAILHSKGSARFPKNNKKAFGYFTQSAEKNNVDALTGLGYCYKEGIGVAKNTELATIYFEKAAIAGDATARTNLIALLKSAPKTKSNSEKIIYWLTKAAQEGEVELPRLSTNSHLGSSSAFFSQGSVSPSVVVADSRVTREFR